MELVWLVYGISLLDKFTVAFTTLLSFLGIGILCYFAFITTEYLTPKERSIHYTRIKKVTAGALIMMIVLISIPSEKTAYTMVAAYATQKVAERPETQELASDVLVIINNKVKRYAIESSEELEKYKKK